MKTLWESLAQNSSTITTVHDFMTHINAQDESEDLSLGKWIDLSTQLQLIDDFYMANFNSRMINCCKSFGFSKINCNTNIFCCFFFIYLILYTWTIFCGFCSSHSTFNSKCQNNRTIHTTDCKHTITWIFTFFSVITEFFSSKNSKSFFFF